MNGEILAFYSERRGKRINNAEDSINEMKRTETGIVVFKKKKWDKLAPKFENWGDAHYFKMGQKEFFWLDYDSKKGQ